VLDHLIVSSMVEAAAALRIEHLESRYRTAAFLAARQPTIVDSGT